MPKVHTLEKASHSFRISGLLISALKKLIRSSISVEGLENLRANPTLFVVNHFTRMETGILPYVLYQFNGQMVHSLADSSLFVGKLGQFLTSVGAYPLNLKGRDEKIISELMRGSYNWVIFPEGSMVKNKKVVDRKRLRMQLPDATRAPYTGAATLALKTFLMKQEYIRAIADNDEELINYYQDTYQLYGPGDLAPLDLCIVPVNITYYPLRPGKNILSTAVQMLIKDLSPEAEEELLVEGKLLLQEGDISISFGHPIDIRDFTQVYRRLFAYLPFVSAAKKRNALIAIMRHRLTRIFMHRVYMHLSINMDHLVATALRYLPAKGMPEGVFKQILYLTVNRIKTEHHRRVHASLGDGTINLVSGEAYQPYDNIMQLVETEKVARRENAYLFADHEKIKKQHAFHRVRLESTTRVLANEFEVMSGSVAVIKKLMHSSFAKLSFQVSEAVKKRDCALYEQERMRSFDKQDTKSREVGKPRHLRGDKNKPGIVLAHGFLSAPGELLALAEYLNQRGYGVYLARLAGHGTHPSELDTVTVKSWSESLKRGYAVLSHYHAQVLVGGFSGGALLALLKGACSVEQVAGIVVINPALKIRQKSSRFSPMLDKWNKALESVSLPQGTVKWVENKPENPDTNYQQIYISALRQLLELQETCVEKLSAIRAPILVIQGKEDPVVDPSGAREIIHKVNSANKKLEEIMFKRHVIVRGHASIEVFKVIEQFMETL